MDEQQTPAALLDRFYTDNNLGPDGGVNARAVEIQMGRFFRIYFPNFPARKKCVLRHDVHHLLTGYPTTISGESQISAWELASGCRRYWAAFMINVSGLMIGMPWNIGPILRAYARGRRTGNLYDPALSDDIIRHTSVAEWRSRLQLDRYGADLRPTAADVFHFLLMMIPATLYTLLSILLALPLSIYSIYVRLSGTYKKTK